MQHTHRATPEPEPAPEPASEPEPEPEPEPKTQTQTKTKIGDCVSAEMNTLAHPDLVKACCCGSGSGWQALLALYAALLQQNLLPLLTVQENLMCALGHDGDTTNDSVGGSDGGSDGAGGGVFEFVSAFVREVHTERARRKQGAVGSTPLHPLQFARLEVHLRGACGSGGEEPGGRQLALQFGTISE